MTPIEIDLDWDDPDERVTENDASSWKTLAPNQDKLKMIKNKSKIKAPKIVFEF